MVKNGDSGERQWLWGAQCSCCLQEQAFVLTLLVAPSLSLRLDSETTEAGPPLEKWRMCQGIHAPLPPLVEGIMAVLDAGSVAIWRMHAWLLGTAADGLSSAAAEATAPRRRLPMRNRTASACSAIAARLCAKPGSKSSGCVLNKCEACVELEPAFELVRHVKTASTQLSAGSVHVYGLQASSTHSHFATVTPRPATANPNSMAPKKKGGAKKVAFGHAVEAQFA